MTPLYPEPLELPPDAALLARYLSGECTSAERVQIEHRISADASYASEVEQLRAIWARKSAERYDPSALWTRVAASTVEKDQAPVKRVSRPGLRHATLTPSIPWRRVVPLAAALVLAVGTLIWQRYEPAPVSGPNQTIQQREVATRRAQRAEVYLSDGTRVVLGVASKIRFASPFGATRDVWLEGEAYFDVVHDETRPFAVHTARGIARDIGTRFAVRAYPDDRAKDLEVVVEEGIVALGRDLHGDSVVLGASDVGRVTAKGKIETLRGVDVSGLLSWTDGKLEFRNTPLRDALPVLSRWYDVNLRAGDSTLAGYPITLSLTSERFSDAIEVITRALSARVERRGNEYILNQGR